MAEEEEMYNNIFVSCTNISEKTLQSFGKENNIVFSPFILQKFLSLLSQDQSYYNKHSFKSALYFYDNRELYIKCYKNLISSLHSINSEIFSLTNKLFTKTNYKLQDSFKSILNDFSFDLDNADFNKKGISTKLNDTWVEEKTRSLVRDLITGNNLSDNTHLALLEGSHFKCNWDSSLNIEVNPRKFHLNENEVIKTQMMNMKAEVYYKFDEYRSVSAVELPLSSDDFSLILVLPDKGECPTNLLWGVTENMTKELVEVSLPKFKLEQLTNCRNIFPNLYLEEEFKDNVYLFDIIQSNEFLKYSQIEEKAFISVDEEGAEAASGLAVTMVPEEFDKEDISPDGLKISEVAIKTTISNRFAKTLVTCRVQNKNNSAKEATFNVVLPEAAFITEFVMEMDGKSYKSYIKEVKEAKAIYDEAISQGRSAGIVQADTRDSTQFNVSVNLEPQSVAEFLLTYEEMLQRTHDQYELVVNICPQRIVDIINVEVNINESRPLKFVKTPPLRSGKEIDPKMETYLVPSSDIEMINSNSSVIKFSADAKQQQKISTYFGTPVSSGFMGQFIVQYDVERDPRDGEILLQDGYFVHFFAPNDLDPLPKHVVFVLDTSSSMIGRKLDQLKDAMMSILNDVREGDLISIIEFNSDVMIWDIDSRKPKIIYSDHFDNFVEPFEILQEISPPPPTLVSKETICKAKNVVQNILGEGSTFMIGGLETALYMIKVGQDKIVDKSSKHQPIVVFLTDGYPNVGCSSTSEITKLVTQLNLKNNNVPIFSLSFGEGADKSFLRELSLKNFGFARHIYEASDASLQLQLFYKQISSPLLTDIKFKYETDVTEVTRSHFPIYFRGGELVVSGRCGGCQLPNTINGCGPRGYLNLQSIIKNPVTSLERLWAYLTVKQLLEERCIVQDKEELTKKAVDIALKYSFVTEVTSLVVVRPEEICESTDNTILENLDSNREGRPKKKAIKKRVIKKVCKDQSESGTYICEIPESIEVVETIRPRKLKFVADHPFLVVIALKKGDKRLPLFVGWVHKPSN